MRAAGLDFNRRILTSFEMPEPGALRPGEVRFRVREVGICGTDRELASFAIGFPPRGASRLVLGHEALGQVVDTGTGTDDLKAGDWVVPFVRRPCSPPCRSCARDRRDLCLTGRAPERGIFGAHGYFTEYAVDAAADVVRVPQELVDVAVLIEPLSVVEKTVETALRLHVEHPRTALVLGAGPIGILAALALQERGLKVAIHSLEPEEHPRARLVRDAGMEYSKRIEAEKADVLIEATGSAAAAFAGFRALAPLGVYGILGSPNAQGEVPFIDMLVKNQVLFGSVNAGPGAFARAVTDLARFDRRILTRMLHRVRFEDFATTIPTPQPAVKTVHVIE